MRYLATMPRIRFENPKLLRYLKMWGHLINDSTDTLMACAVAVLPTNTPTLRANEARGSRRLMSAFNRAIGFIFDSVYRWYLRG